MSIDVKCPHCDEEGSVGDDRAGRRTVCPTCGETFTVPLVSSGPPPMPRRRPIDDERGRPRSRDADHDDLPSRRGHDDEDDRPRRRPAPEPEPSKVNKGMVVGGAVSILIAIVWLVVGIVAFNRWSVIPPIMAFFGVVSIVRGLLGHHSK